MQTPGVQLSVPARTSAAAPEPVRVTMVADLATYRAVNGILDHALQVVLVRRDQPGVAFMAKTDPGMLPLPDPVLPPPDGPPDPGARVTEIRELGLLDYGAEHDGSASYFVLATFAGGHSDVQRMEVEHPTRALPAWPAAPVPRRSDVTDRLIAARPSAQGVWVGVVEGPPRRLDGVLRVPFRVPAQRGAAAPGPWVTIVAWQDAAHAQVAALSVRLEPFPERTDHVAAFSIPLERLMPRLAPGRAKVWVFSGDFAAAPLDVDID